VKQVFKDHRGLPVLKERPVFKALVLQGFRVRQVPRVSKALQALRASVLRVSKALLVSRVRQVFMVSQGFRVRRVFKALV
jgi:hypothetical protein